MNKDLFAFPTPFTPPTAEEDHLLWLRLIRSRKVGPATFWRLLEEHGDAAAALDALPAMARAAGLDDYTPCPPGVAHAELAAGRRLGARLVARGAPGYPPRLAEIADAPPLLWMLGEPELALRPMVALVGARNASSLGLRMARHLAEGLTGAGFGVVSGLARGIDAAAHGAALAGGTVAVHAGGVDTVYPRENAALAAEIARCGLRLSEQPLGLEPQARHFPQRNRLISGLAEAVIVVEAAPQSGSLITARDALDQGREVLAVPGHPVDARAAGCNALIRDGAVLVRGIADVLQALEARPAAPVAAAQTAQTARPQPSGPGPGPVPPPLTSAAPQTPRPRHAAARPPAGDSPRQSRQPGPHDAPARTDRRSLAETAALHSTILDRLSPSPIAEDALIRELSMPAAQVTPELVALELDGRIERMPGGFVARRH
ncbi:DNA-processing protein DprA [Frigidibacter sp. MR17.24]|uniref:DNA-processing protein DprA n=1 Tax=Frigidibacter sp. MR17.24 TaxID=3127345 RepID=UPI0030131633